MNNGRRKELRNLANKLKSNTNQNDLEFIASIKNELESILYEEESYMDNIPENLQGGYRYQMAEDACDNIESAIDALNENELNEAIDYIYNAAV